MNTAKRSYQAPSQSLRCIAHAPTTVKGEGAQCMRARKVGEFCRQHAKLLVSLPDGYNGQTALFFAEPIERNGDLVKLACAEPGKGHLIRWARTSDLSGPISREEADDQEPFVNGPDTAF